MRPSLSSDVPAFTRRLPSRRRRIRIGWQVWLFAVQLVLFCLTAFSFPGSIVLIQQRAQLQRENDLLREQVDYALQSKKQIEDELAQIRAKQDGFRAQSAGIPTRSRVASN